MFELEALHNNLLLGHQRHRASHAFQAIKIATKAHGSFAFALEPTSSRSSRDLLSRSTRSHPIRIRELPDSSWLLAGPGLSPPPPIRFRTVTYSTHKRARSAPSPVETSTPVAHRRISHTRAQSSPALSSHGFTIELCDRDHRDLVVCSAGAGGICNLRHPEQSQSVCEKGKEPGRRRGVTRTVRFQLDDEKISSPATDASIGRSVSDLLRLEDGDNSWF